MGWTLAAAAGACLAGWTDVRAGAVAATRSAFGIAALLLGASVLFWGLGGAWEGDDYLRDAQPRFAAVRVGGWSEEGQRSQGEETPANESASLTLTSAPGALVYVDDARTVAMRAPFVGAPLSAGPHTFRLHLGDASNDLHIGPVATDAGDEIVLMPLGPTLSYGEMAGLLVVRDQSGELTPGRALQAGKAPGGVALVALALGALLVGAGAMSAGAPPAAGPLALAAVAQGVTTAAIGPFLLLRVAFLLSLAPRMGMLIAGVGVLSLAATAKRALALNGVPSRWMALVAGAPAGLTLVSLGTDGPRKAAFVLVAAGIVTAGLLLTAATRADVAGDRGAGPGLSQALFEGLPERLGALLVSFDRWVVDGVAGAAAVLMRMTVWVAARSDVHVLCAPADGVAVRATRLGHGLGPLVGGSLARVVWALLALLAAVVVAHAIWRRG